jgi:DNA polymerase II large subunit
LICFHEKHEIKNFSYQERFGKADHTHVNRIAKLTSNKQELIRFINELEQSGKKLSIKSMVEIKVTDMV